MRSVGAPIPSTREPLGSALIDFFRKAGAFVIATTHHPIVKMFAASTPGAQNSSVELDEETLRPTYVLRHGVAGGSSGFEVAEQLGLPIEIVTTGRGFLKKKDLQIESYLIRLRQELESLQKAQTGARQQIERIRKREAKLEETFRTRERETGASCGTHHPALQHRNETGAGALHPLRRKPPSNTESKTGSPAPADRPGDHG